MKINNYFVQGMLVLVLACGLIFVGCKDPSGENPLAGTKWSRDANPAVHLIFDDDTFHLTNDWTDVGMHPYTVSGNTMTYFRTTIKVTLDFSIEGTRLVFSNANPPTNLTDYSPFTLIR